MRKQFGTAVAFVLGALAIAFIFLRDLLMPDKAKHEAAKLNLDAKKADVEVKKDGVAAAETAAAATHESVGQRLAKLEEEAQKQHGRDSVDVANDIIKGA